MNTVERNRDPRFQMICALVSTVNEFPEGAPEGPIYLALMQHGIGYDTYTKIINSLCEAKIIRRSGNLLFPIVREAK